MRVGYDPRDELRYNRVSKPHVTKIRFIVLSLRSILTEYKRRILDIALNFKEFLVMSLNLNLIYHRSSLKIASHVSTITVAILS